MIPATGMTFFLFLLGLLAWHWRWLSLGGAMASALLGGLIWAGGEWKAFCPLLFFFLSGTLLGKLPAKVISDNKQHLPRDAMQVWCNGGVAGLMMALQLWRPHPEWLWLLYVSLAVSTADTWSSSIGQWRGGRVINLANGRSAMPGLSGGISVLGTLAGFAGAFSTGMLMILAAGAGWQLAGMVGLAGFAGMLADSWMGGMWQAKYRLPNGVLADFIPDHLTGHLERGSPAISNDMVNLLSNLFIVFAMAVYFWILV